MQKKKIIIVSSIAAMGILVGGIFLYRNYFSSEAVSPRVGPVVEAVYGLGTVIAAQSYAVKTAVNQRISEIYVKEGDKVSIGAPLLRFDDSGLSRAPISGTITAVPFKKGELLFSATPGLILVNLENLFLEVSLEQQTVLSIKRGQKVAVSFESIRGEKISGNVESIFPRDSQFIVRIALTEYPHTILPGMTADVAIEIGRKEGALSIPLRAIRSGKVTIKRSGKKISNVVQVGVIDGDWAEVLSGNIKADDKVMVRSK